MWGITNTHNTHIHYTLVGDSEDQICHSHTLTHTYTHTNDFYIENVTTTQYNKYV